MATVTSKGKKRIQTNNGHVKLSLNDNRMLMYDGSKYRFLTGDNNNNETKVLITKEDIGVLDA